MGEGAEVDLFESLKQEFEGDQIERVSKGAAGADIIHDVIHGGKVCSRIVYDAKNRNAWRNEYVTKLREDRIAAGAEHAILSSLKFPADARQLHVQDGVIIANPARVPALVQMLRRHIAQIHTLRLSNIERDSKTDALATCLRSRPRRLPHSISKRTMHRPTRLPVGKCRQCPWLIALNSVF